MRAFIAIETPEEISRKLAEAQARFRQTAMAARWTAPNGFHLTLKFLGQIADHDAKAVSDKLAALGSFEKFRVEVRGFGYFPNARGPRVLWAGIQAPPALAELAGRVEDAMAELGFEREGRDFHPHLTLARFKFPRPQPALAPLVTEMSERTFGWFEVSEFFLWESELSPAGASYRKLARLPHPGYPQLP